MVRDLRFLIYIILLTCFLTAQETNRPKVGLVLSGGGAKGFAHIGVLKVLEKQGIPIDYIAGTSIGSIIGGLYSIGYSADQLDTLVRSQDWNNLLSDNISREYINIHEKDESDRYIVSFLIEPGAGPKLPSGLVQGQNIINLLSRITVDVHANSDFSNFPISFAAIATDLETGQPVIIKDGSLPEAMLASMAIPTVFAPVEYQGQLLVDGGIVNNFPSDVVKEMGADIIIGIDIQTGLFNKSELKQITDVVTQLTSFLDYKKNKENKKLCNLIIKPDITGFDVGSFNAEAVDSLINRGVVATEKMLPEIKKMIPGSKVINRNKPGILGERNFKIDNLSVKGVNKTGISYILEKTDFEFPAEMNFNLISQGLNRLYGTNSFDRVYFKLFQEESTVLQVNVDEKNEDFLNLGFNYNSEEQAAILLNFTYRNKLIGGTRISAEVLLSADPEIKSSFQFVEKNLPEIGIDLFYKSFEADLFERRNKIANTEVNYLKADFYTFEIFGSNNLVRAGLIGEYYDFKLFSAEPDIPLIVDNTENGLLSAYFRILMDDLDDRYFPRSGERLDAIISFTSNKFNDIFNSKKTTTIQYDIKSVLPLGSDVTFLSELYGRLILDNNFDEFKMNVIGGPEYAIHLDNYLPFIGVERMTPVSNKVMCGLANVRVRLSENNYVSGIFNLATHFNNFKDWETRDFIYGFGAEYSYNSMIGPLSVLMAYSDYTERLKFTFNIGFWL